MEDGFITMDPPQSLTEDDLQKIEEEMAVSSGGASVERLELPRDEVISIFMERGKLTSSN